jgi:hypothetical protein
LLAATAVATMAPRFIPSAANIQEASEVLNVLQRILVKMSGNACRVKPEFQQFKEIYKSLGTEVHEAKKAVEVERRAKAAPMLGPAKPGMSILERAKQLGRVPMAPFFTPRPAPVALQPRAKESAEVPLQVGRGPADLAEHPSTQHSPLAPPGLPLALPKFMSTLGPVGNPKVVSKGPEVQALQQLLAHLGYDVPQTGVYELRTIRVVQALQEQHDHPVTSLVGAQLRRVFNDMVTG